MVNEVKDLIRGKGPVTADDVERIGIEREKILDFGPMEGVLPKTFPATEPAGVMMLSLWVSLSTCD
jgi:hypothetical protein